MFRTPKGILFALLAITIVVILSLQSLQNQSVKYIRFLISAFPEENSIFLARYYWVTGRQEQAIEEYKKALDNASVNSNEIIYNDLRQLLLSERDVYRQAYGYIAYSSWAKIPIILIVALIAGIMLALIFLFRFFKKQPSFVILPFEDYSGLNLGNNIPEIAHDRIREIVWRAKNIDSASNFISESLEVPSLSMISEGDTADTVGVLQTALKYSIGFSDFPLARLVESVKLWLQQPQFQVRGILDRKSDTININMILIDRTKNCIENVWHVELPSREDCSITDIIDSIIYPLLFYFNKDHIHALRWDSLHALHVGMEEFQRYTADQFSVAHLENAKKHLELALEVDPGYSLAQYDLSLVLMAMGDYDKARQVLREIILSQDEVQ